MFQKLHTLEMCLYTEDRIRKNHLPISPEPLLPKKHPPIAWITVYPSEWPSPFARISRHPGSVFCLPPRRWTSYPIPTALFCSFLIIKEPLHLSLETNDPRFTLLKIYDLHSSACNVCATGQVRALSRRSLIAPDTLSKTFPENCCDNDFSLDGALFFSFRSLCFYLSRFSSQ